MEVQTGTQNRPAMLLRTAQGAVCPAEALIGSHCRGPKATGLGDSGGEIFVLSSFCWGEKDVLVLFLLELLCSLWVSRPMMTY